MKTHNHLPFIIFFLALSLINLAGTGCSSATTTPSLPVYDQTPTVSLPPATAAPLPSPSPPPPLVLLIAPTNAQNTLSQQVQTILTRLSSQAGFRLQVQAALTPDSLAQNPKLVVALPPNSDLAELASVNANIQFLGIGFSGLKLASNLSILLTATDRPDQLAFIAGSIGAVITPDWRTAILVPKDSPASQVARQAFLNGARYFCGLCRPAYPPFNEYPTAIEISDPTDPLEEKAVLDELVQQSVQTVFVFPGSGEDTLLKSISDQGLNLIGSQDPPTEVLEHWAATIDVDLESTLRTLWSTLIAGQGNLQLEAPLRISQTNELLFSAGRQQWVNRILTDLVAGAIDTGAQSIPLTP